MGRYAQVGVIVSNRAKHILSRYQHCPVHIVTQLCSVSGQNLRLYISDTDFALKNFSLKLLTVFTLVARMKPGT